MRLLLITSCTGSKAVSHPRRLTQDDFINPARLAARERELSESLLPAGRMYTGMQHVQAMHGVEELRARFGHDSVAVRIVSAGYGLLSEDRPIVPYEVTFSSMTPQEGLAWARRLGLARDVRAAVKDWPLIVFLLGDKYLRAVEIPLQAAEGQRLFFLARPGEADLLTAPGITIVPAGLVEAKRYGAGLVFLKGRMFAFFAAGLAREGEGVWGDLLRDGTAGTFIRLVEKGLNLQ